LKYIIKNKITSFNIRIIKNKYKLKPSFKKKLKYIIKDRIVSFNIRIIKNKYN